MLIMSNAQRKKDVMIKKTDWILGIGVVFLLTGLVYQGFASLVDQHKVMVLDTK